MQSYVESNNFTNPNAISAGQDAIWEFALAVDNGAANSSYCFRIVSDTGVVLGSCSSVAEIIIPPQQNRILRHGRWFNTRGAQQPFAW